MAVLSQVAFAREAGVAQPSVNRAIKRGRLRASGSGGLNVDDPVNAEWLARHKRGYDSAGRVLATNQASHHRRGSSKRPTDALDVLNADVDELLAPRMTDAEIDALLRHDDDADVRALRDAFRLELTASAKMLGEVFRDALEAGDNWHLPGGGHLRIGANQPKWWHEPPAL